MKTKIETILLPSKLIVLLFLAVNAFTLDTLASDTAEAQRFRQETKLTSGPDGAPGDECGTTVAIAGATAVIGCPKDDIGSNIDQGSAYVFVRAGGVWVQQAKLTAADGMAGDRFGHSVTISTTSAPAQTVIMVGAFAHDSGGQSNRGAVYVFNRSQSSTTWAPGGKLTASDGLAEDAFGASVAMTGSFAIIGANGDDIDQAGSAGSAYIFVRNGTIWEEEQKLTTPGTQTAFRNFGWSVDISGTRAIIGSNQQNSDTGYVSVFERGPGGNTWTWVLGFQGTGKLGYSVAASGETIVMGAFASDIDSNLNQGRAVAYEKSGSNWLFQGTLTSGSGRANDAFGKSVAISGDTIAVGANGVDPGTVDVNQGAAYVFTRSNGAWTERQKLVDTTGGQGDQLGWSIDVSGDTIVSGALTDDVNQAGDQGSASVFAFAPSAAPFDYDGDGRADFSIFRPSDGSWYLQRSSSGSLGTSFGLASDVIVPADYDGDGKTDIAIYRSSTGTWYINNSSNGTSSFGVFGIAEDLPVPADYDGDGKADLAVFRPSSGTWYRTNSSNGSFTAVQFGQAGDRPTLGDFDGDGKADVAVFRPGVGAWYQLNSSNGTFYGEQFGSGSDKIAPADYDADGRTDIAIYRPSDGLWYYKNSSNGTYTPYVFGLTTDVPVAADYDGDGRADIAVFRPSDGYWYIVKSTTGTFTIFQWGQNGDRPTPAAFGN